jgi:hypothetical protein
VIASLGAAIGDKLMLIEERRVRAVATYWFSQERPLECRLMELYIDGNFQACCAINNGWKLRKPGVPLELSSDQFLNNIIKPKTTSSGN